MSVRNYHPISLLSNTSKVYKMIDYVSGFIYVSNVLPVKSGVPQCSILGPLLFIIYINGMTSSIINANLFLFADDAKCFKNVDSYSEQQLLQEDIHKLPVQLEH